nr:RHS repeat-associated core domain-containing protein [uncultured Pedobacter sp.]
MSEALTYDVMGNIASLNRDATGAKVYNYYNSGSSNRLQSVSGLTTQNYEYDANGNATKDGLNGFSLSYNYLNLPATAVRTTGTAVSLLYTYDATGKKLAKNSNGTVRNYVDGIEYKPDGTTIDIIHTEEGIARNSGGTYSYEYNLSDHLGNVRVTFKLSPLPPYGLEVIQRDDYYAFGLRKTGSPNSNTNKYLYNGKELQEELGAYDYGARFYDPIVGRWNVVDPLAELSRRFSPYTYGNNNPIRFIDPDGMMTTDAGGNIYSDSVEDAQAMFRQLQSAFSSQNQDDPKKKKKEKAQTGSYSNTHASDKKYHGKGSEKRAQASGVRVAKKHDDPVVDTEWKPADNERQAFKDEDDRINTDEGGHNSDNNYNQRASPGKKYKEQDKKKSEEPDAFKTIKSLNPIDGLRVRPILPSDFKPHPAVTVGGVIMIIIGGVLFFAS